MWKHKTVIASALIAWMVFWLLPRAWQPMPLVRAVEMTADQEDRFLLLWLTNYDSACRAAFPPPANKTPATAKFCFCVARQHIVGMDPDEYREFLKHKALPESVAARSHIIRKACSE